MTGVEESGKNRIGVDKCGPDAALFQPGKKIVLPDYFPHEFVGGGAQMTVQQQRYRFPGVQCGLSGSALGKSGNTQERIDRFYGSLVWPVLT